MGLRSILKEILPTITSPVFSEIVIVFSDREIFWASLDLDKELREIYEIREFRLAFCLETMEQTRVVDLRALRLVTQSKVEKGFYDFLTQPPVIFSRTFPSYDLYVNRFREY